MSESIFPGNDKDAEATYTALVDKGRKMRNPYKAKWGETHAYLEGMRNLILNFRNGTVRTNRTDKQGRLRFVYEELLSKYDTQRGRLLGMDLSPRVTRRNESLTGERDAAIDEAVLAHIFPTSRITKLKRAIIPPLLCYGTVGLRLWEDPKAPKEQDIKVVMPWQITPIPLHPATPTSIRGLIIRKKCPVEDLRRVFTDRKRGALANAEKITVSRGDLPAETPTNTDFYTSDLDAYFDEISPSDMSGTKSAAGSDRGSSKLMDVAWLGQVYLWDDRDYMIEEIAFVGTKLLQRVRYDLTRTYKLVTTAHGIDVGGFFSRSWMEIQIPLNREIEGGVGRSFQNVRELNLHGITLAPTNMGLTRQAIIHAKDGVKFMPYAWDQLTPPKDSVIQIRPFSTGAFPAQMVKMGVDLSDRIANQPAAISRGEAPGRIDSAAALGTLMETSSIPIAPMAVAIADAMGDMYRTSLCRALVSWQGADTVAVNMLTNSMAGMAYDPQKGTISLSNNGIVHPDAVEVTVQSMLPISKQQQIFELKDHLEKGLIDPFEYRITARLLSLDLPVGNEAEWLSYQKAVSENVLLAQGIEELLERPEEEIGVLFSRDGDMHEVHVRVHRELIALRKFATFDAIVRQRILGHLARHLSDGLGQIPEGMPDIEGAAEEFLQFNPQNQGQQMPMMAG